MKSRVVAVSVMFLSSAATLASDPATDPITKKASPGSTGTYHLAQAMTQPNPAQAQSELQQYWEEIDALRAEVRQAIAMIEELPGPFLDSETQLDDAIRQSGPLANTLAATLPPIGRELNQLDTDIRVAAGLFLDLKKHTETLDSISKEACRLESMAVGMELTAGLLQPQIKSTRTKLDEAKGKFNSARSEVERISLGEKTSTLIGRINELLEVRRMVEQQIQPVAQEIGRTEQQQKVVEMLEGEQDSNPAAGLLNRLSNRIQLFKATGLDTALPFDVPALEREAEQLRKHYQEARVEAGKSWRAERLQNMARSGSFDLITDEIADIKWASQWLEQGTIERANNSLEYTRQLAAILNMPERPELIVQKAEACLVTASQGTATRQIAGGQSNAGSSGRNGTNPAIGTPAGTDDTPVMPAENLDSVTGNPDTDPLAGNSVTTGSVASTNKEADTTVNSVDSSTVILPDVIGLKLETAVFRLRPFADKYRLNLGLDESGVAHNESEHDTIGAVIPASGLLEGQSVRLVVRKFGAGSGEMIVCEWKPDNGPPPEEFPVYAGQVPSVTGWPVRKAFEAVECAGLTPVIVLGSEATSSGPRPGREGDVEQVIPEAGWSRPPGSDVLLHVYTSSTLPGCIVPRIEGFNEAGARGALQRNRVSDASLYPTDEQFCELFLDLVEGPQKQGVEPGVIYDQYPEPGDEVPRGTGIRGTLYRAVAAEPSSGRGPATGHRTGTVSRINRIDPDSPGLMCCANSISHRDIFGNYSGGPVMRPAGGWPTITNMAGRFRLSFSQPRGSGYPPLAEAHLFWLEPGEFLDDRIRLFCHSGPDVATYTASFLIGVGALQGLVIKSPDLYAAVRLVPKHGMRLSDLEEYGRYLLTQIEPGAMLCG